MVSISVEVAFVALTLQSRAAKVRGMTVAASRPKVTPQQVLADLAGFSAAQLDRLVPEVLALRVEKRKLSLSRRETSLLRGINRTLPETKRAAYVALSAKRREETLTAAEHRELLRLSDELESLNVERLHCLTELAGLRATSVPKLMRELGLRSLAHG